MNSTVVFALAIIIGVMYLMKRRARLRADE
jgi:hypothetical protein